MGVFGDFGVNSVRFVVMMSMDLVLLGYIF